MCKNKTYFFLETSVFKQYNFHTGNLNILENVFISMLCVFVCMCYVFVTYSTSCCCLTNLWIHGSMECVCARVMTLMQKYFCFSVPIFKVEAVRTLVLDDRQTCLLGDSKWQCTRLSWYKGKGHRCNSHHTYLSLKLCRFLTFKGIVYCNTTFIVYMNTCLLIILC